MDHRTFNFFRPVGRTSVVVVVVVVVEDVVVVVVVVVAGKGNGVLNH